ncbi:MAG: isoprenylcysteine carboxylmethyltransferase family protein [Terriglobia bacterium]
MALLYFYICQPIFVSFLWGSWIALLGILLRAWASGHLYKNQRVATSGPYAFTRNPLYLGSFIIGLGFCLIARSYAATGIFVFLFAVLYIPSMQRETEYLRETFGAVYSHYEAGVPVFFPRWTPFPCLPNSFNFHQYFANKEYKAGLGYLGALALLLLKMRLA